MPLHLLAANGTVRTILVLMIVWLLLRAWSRARQTPAARPGTGPQRPKGEVRIERIDTRDASRPGHGPVEDADFEEIKHPPA
jgi:hypothetical protein